MLVNNLVEKPGPELAPSLLGIQGRYIFTSDLFYHLNELNKDCKGELQLTDAMRMLSLEQEVYSWTFLGKRYDIGTMKDWFQSHLELSFVSQFSPILKEVMKGL